MGEQRTLKGKHVDMLDAIAKKLGVDPSEAFGHVVARAHEQMFGSGGGQGGAHGVPESHGVPKDANDPVARKERHDATNRIAGREDGDPQTAKKALEQVVEPHDGHATEDSSNEHQDSPKMKGEKPNPLAIHSSKRWASTKSPDDEEDEKKPAAQKKTGLLRGRAQR